ncbi:hypothetical protein CC85DRAFT_284754 [Cutaneotrichosporon oleaginosum]|uniref:Helicase ATP-binding domain-containing protein n=1 Tax=Cutaneotrichosporon oleaginosum TaxID=879819 RepID=A0A0J0XQ50_9TREE|nr:uncharacterized protein CC85DRAFT_284754 [Cutaneotrichosporon oleaginosum]KLT43197.1 hypothetical protein CC85DRAFT_284754 [Cutaneotrichosporon oleaginosum]TXT09879.1 hypothetical protein COLE_03813 [Cutaneotrichosporon oleaginosum]
MSHARRACAVASRLARASSLRPVAAPAFVSCSRWRSLTTGAGPSTSQFGMKQSGPFVDYETAPKPPTEAEAGPFTSIDSVDAWTKAGIPRPVIDRLLAAYPECVAPTPAQLAFLLGIAKGDVDIFLRDYMGRGKTFALVLAALAIVENKGRVVVMLPTPHLARQVTALLLALGDARVSTVSNDGEADLNARVLLGTPRSFLALAGKKRNMTLGDRLKGVTHVFVDEIDSQIGPLPHSRMTKSQLERHPSRKHTPAVADALNSLFGIKVKQDGYIDFSGRKNITSVFSSATLDNTTRRHIYGRGWVRPKGGAATKHILDLDFSAAATPKQVALRDTMAVIAKRAGAVSAQPTQRKPRHYAFSVSPEGKIVPLDLARPGDSGFIPPVVDEKGREIDLDTLPLKGKSANKPRPGLPVTLLEGMAYLHATVPPPSGTYSLAVLPDGASVTGATTELAALGLNVIALVPEVLEGGIEPPPATAPHIMLLTTRAAVPGLHLPHLHSIYLLNGLDVSKLSKSAKMAGGREGQSLVYSIITGRLGRLATEVGDPANPQRVVSIVQHDSYEEWALRHMFGDMYTKWQFALSQWPGEIS